MQNMTTSRRPIATERGIQKNAPKPMKTEELEHRKSRRNGFICCYHISIISLLLGGLAALPQECIHLAAQPAADSYLAFGQVQRQ